MRGLADAWASAPLHGAEDILMTDEGDDYDFFKACLDEIDKQRRRDEWIPTYHNTLTTTALTCRHTLAKAGCIEKNPVEFLQYTQQGGAEDLRIAAFDHLLDLGYGRAATFISFFLSELSSDPSPYVRQNILRLFGKFLGSVAIGSDEGSQKAAAESQEDQELVIEQDASNNKLKEELARKRTVPGALEALKTELQSNEALKTGIWDAVCSQTETLPEIEDLLMICSFLYDPNTAMMVRLRYPRYWQTPELERLPASGRSTRPKYLLKFKKGQVRTKRLGPKWTPSAQRPAAPPKRESTANGVQRPIPPIKIRQPSMAAARTSPAISTPQSGGQPKIKLVFKKPKAGSGSPTSTVPQTPR